MAAEVQRFQILGPFHSGTCLLFNYLQALFEARGSYHTHVWKHSVPPHWRRLDGALRTTACEFDPAAVPETLFIVLVRSPYFWLNSMLEQAYDTRFADPTADRSRRLRTPVQLYQARAANLVRLWTHWYRAYETHLATTRSVVRLRLEDLVTDPETTLDRLAALGPRGDVDRAQAIRRIDRTPAKVHDRPAIAGDEARRRYVDDNVPNFFDPVDLAFVNQQLDAELLARLGYRIVPARRAWSTPVVQAAEPGVGAARNGPDS